MPGPKSKSIKLFSSSFVKKKGRALTLKRTALSKKAKCSTAILALRVRENKLSTSIKQIEKGLKKNNFRASDIASKKADLAKFKKQWTSVISAIKKFSK